MAYTTINKSTDHFNTKLYTGNGSTQSITGVGFQPDWVWFKIRNTTGDNRVFDVVRGAEARLYTNGAQAEASPDTGTLTSFDSDGFSVGNSDVNINGSSQVSWNWKAGNSSGSSNSDGSITSTVSANTTAGFSVVKYTGNESGAPKTVGHGLGVAPKMIMIKRLNDSIDWQVYHDGIGNTKRLNLNTTDATTTTSSTWNNTTPTSSVFTINSNHGVNHTGSDFIAYCFAEKKGFSKFGSYTGNGHDNGAFIYTGFKPGFILIKSATTAMYWHIFDKTRLGYNAYNYRLNPNATDAETTTTDVIDILSNGFKIRTNQQQFGTSGATYIYWAIAEAPLVGTNNIPVTAR